jgi:hypothetical protein
MRVSTRLFATICLWLSGCATLTPQTALTPPETRAALGVVQTPTGLQSAYNAVAKAEANVPQGDVPNRSSPVLITGTIPLTKQLRVPGNAVSLGTGNGALLTWFGKEPPIILYSAVGNGASSGVTFDKVSIYAPNARALWEWDRPNHQGNAGLMTVSNCRLTAAGTHLNCEAPGDGRLYWPTFENVQCFGTGNMVSGRTTGGRFINCLYVGKHCDGYVIDLHDSEASFENCWIEPTGGSSVLRSRGAFSIIHWNSYSEAHDDAHVRTLPVFEVAGAYARLITDTLHFSSPLNWTLIRDGAAIEFRGPNPGGAGDNGGWHIDFTRAMSPALLAYAVETMRRTFVFEDDGSVATWAGGRVDAKGVTTATTRPTSEVGPQQ